MAHAAARRRRTAGDEAGHRLLAATLGFVAQELGGVFFGRAADFADHDDRLGGFVGQEHFQDVDELGALDRVAADADSGRLTEARIGRLEHGFIGQGAGTRHDTDRTRREDVARHDADLALVGRQDARAVRPDQARLGALQRLLHLDHVEHRNAFGDADDQFDLGIDGFQDRVGREGGRHVDGRRGGAGLRLGFGDGVEHRQFQVGRATLAGRDAADHLGAVGNGLAGVEGALGAGDALADDLGFGINQNGH